MNRRTIKELKWWQTMTSGESVFDLKMGPAFFAVIVSIFLSIGQFFYAQGQQNSILQYTKDSTERLSRVSTRQEDKQNSLSERIVKVETIVSTIEFNLNSINQKLDHIVPQQTLDKR